MSVKLLTERHLEFLRLKGGCTGLSESTLVKMPHCWKSHVTAQMFRSVHAIYARQAFPYAFLSIKYKKICVHVCVCVHVADLMVFDRVFVRTYVRACMYVCAFCLPFFYNVNLINFKTSKKQQQYLTF